MSELPDYYAILEITSSASDDDIKRAYRKAALKWHPDRVPHDSPERSKRTKKFQLINDAMYTLSDPTRRRDYDEALRFHGTSAAFDDDDAEDEIPRPPPQNGGPSWANMFGFGKPAQGATQEDHFANDQFKSAFEEMMSEEGLAEGENRHPTKRFWTILGGLSGATLGFILGNFVGLVPGGIAGSKLGEIRDRRGKSVYEVFQGLDQGQKARILSELAAKLFSGAIS